MQRPLKSTHMINKRKSLGLDEFMLYPDGSSGEVVPKYLVKIPSDIVLYLYGMIGDPLDYVEMIHTIRYAEPGSLVVIHINSPGGDLSSCLGIINAIKASQAEVVTINDGEACSAAAIVWLSGHKKVLGSQHVYMMLHEAGWGMHGKAAEHETQVKIMKRVVDGMLKELTGKLLTAEELQDINKGVDVYLHGSDIMKRGSVQLEQELFEDPNMPVSQPTPSPKKAPVKATPPTRKKVHR